MSQGASREERAEGSASGWLGRSTRAGLGLGLVLGAFGQTLLYFHDEKIPLSLTLPAALLTAMLFGLAAALAALLTGPLVRESFARPRTSFEQRFKFSLACGLVVGLLVVLTFFHLLSLWVRVMTGVFPTLAPVEMFWASPTQFLHAGLRGQERRILALLLATALAAELLRRRLCRPLPPDPRWRRTLGLTVVMLLSIAGVAFSPPVTRTIRLLQGSSPELRWLTTWAERNSELDEAVDLLPAIPGPPVAAVDEWTRAAQGSTGPRPNVLLLILESLSAEHVHYAGYPRPVTPNLDRIAAAGWRMSRAWTTATQSNYAQTSILSSLLPLRARHLETYVQLDYPRFLFHDLFATLGYSTATISSQNEDWQGMRKFEATPNLGFFFHSLDHPGPHLGRGTERKLPDHLTTDVLLRWLDGQRGQRWAAYVNFQRTHFPYEAPPGYVGPYQPSDPDPATFSFLDYPPEERQAVVNRYDNALAYVDAQIGRVLAYLEATGQAESTLVAIVADHGEQFGELGTVTHGKNLHEQAVRVPLLLYWPGTLAPREVAQPVSAVDLLPTLVDFLGLPPQPAFQGRSFRDPEAYAAGRPALYMTLQTLSTAYGVVCWPWKLGIDASNGESWLHKLDDDPEEELERFDPSHPAAIELLRLLASQRRAQLDYYTAEDGRRRRQLAPRLLPCPPPERLAPAPVVPRR